MTTQEPPTDRKFFTPEQANRMLPLVKRIVADITSTTRELMAREARMNQIGPEPGEPLNDVYHKDFIEAQEEQEDGVARLHELREELESLGILLKDYQRGLVDFPCWVDGREVYLCWHEGEDAVLWWHEIADGFAGRRPIDEISVICSQQ